METVNIEAGPELDALVAERVMGLDITKYPIQHEHVDIEGRSITEWEETIPNYSTCISAAWEVVEKIKDLGLVIEFYIEKSSKYPEYECNIETRDFNCEYDRGSKCFSSESTMSLAICRAALKAVMFKGVNS